MAAWQHCHLGGDNLKSLCFALTPLQSGAPCCPTHKPSWCTITLMILCPWAPIFPDQWKYEGSFTHHWLKKSTAVTSCFCGSKEVPILFETLLPTWSRNARTFRACPFCSLPQVRCIMALLDALSSYRSRVGEYESEQTWSLPG